MYTRAAAWRTLMPSIKLFGGFQLISDGTPPEIKKSRRADSLIAFLAVNLGKKYQRDLLVGTLCVDMAKPSDGFRTVLKFARDALGVSAITHEPFLYADKTQIWLNAAPDLQVDVAAFNTPSPLPPNLPIEPLAHLALLYTGPFLEGYEIEEYNMVWVMGERTRLETRFNQVMKMLVDQLLQAQRWNEVLDWAEHWLHFAHLPEDAYAALMMAYTGLKDFAKLMETLDRYEREMTEGELPISDAIIKLHKKLETELAKTRTVTVDTQAVFAPNRPRPLPHQTTTFVGRQDHLRIIGEELLDPDCRLLSLIGFGGVGKTRLALQAGLQPEISALFPDGVAFVEMARVKSAESFFAALADALNFSSYGQESLATQIGNYLREKTMLLILDAFEHVLEIDIPNFDVVATLEQQLLITAPKLKVLATSRRRLRAADERVIDLEGLDYPGRPGSNEKTASDYDAVRLFLQIARNRKRDFDVPSALADVVRICQMVQGMPLAIALAAAQIRFFPCKTIVEELTRSLDLLETDDPLAEPRQRTVRAAFDYAWEQLEPNEQAVFRNLAVFPGSFSLDAARAVTGAQMKVLRSLVDWSLLQLDGTRYQLHDLLRQFGGEKLSESSELSAYDRFVRFFGEFAQTKQRDYAALEPEWANLLAGMRFAHERQQWSAVVGYAQSLSEPWFTRGRFTEMRTGMKWACEAAETLTEQNSLASLLLQHGRACFEQGAYDEASECIRASQDIYTKMGDTVGIANTHFEAARIAFERSAFDDTARLLSVSKQLRQQVKDEVGVASVLYEEAKVAYVNRDLALATNLLNEALTVQEQSNNTKALLQTIRLLALALSLTNDGRRAKSYCEQALQLAGVSQDKYEYAVTLYDVAQVSRKVGDLENARKQAIQSISQLSLIGDVKTESHALLLVSYLDEQLGNYPSALQHAEESLNHYRFLQDRLGELQALMQVGDSLLCLGNKNKAIQAWRSGLDICLELQHSDERLFHERIKKSIEDAQ